MLHRMFLTKLHEQSKSSELFFPGRVAGVFGSIVGAGCGFLFLMFKRNTILW